MLPFIHNNDYIYLWISLFRQLYKRKNIIIIDHYIFPEHSRFQHVGKVKRRAVRLS